ncbi:Primase C terminal 2 (PriCT-2) [Flavobacterium omnivorum]|uniref:Primase C terminal 2 (PriCT-2) n=1 Tax=Flavobacterium omnivorum TaxID=178355 RepID=A0A1G7ZFY8_9FLAO|nr:BT4734/BF3469 family protein [Flavobacterium omnivorum]SDH07594.1 Primase C terminal 2 (PriCT-2) [Flavobacterium omnivorum]
MKENNLNILQSKVSYQGNTWTSLSEELTIKEVLEEIKSSKYENKIAKLRNLLLDDKKEEYNTHKKNLPAVTFCATFEKKRRRENIKTYNSIIVIDIDKLESKELEHNINLLKNDSYVFSFWKSPSNEGIKGLVCLKFDFEIEYNEIDKIHKSAFIKLSKYFKDTYDIELDQSGSDTTRLCFFSFDANLEIKAKYEYFEILKLDVENSPIKSVTQKELKIKFASNKDALYNPKDKNKANDRKTISSIISYLSRKNLSITNSYQDWYKVAMVISNTFTYEIGEKYFLKLSSMDLHKYNETNCKNFLLNCFESRNGVVKFTSIIYLANNKGYLTQNQKK